MFTTAQHIGSSQQTTKPTWFGKQLLCTAHTPSPIATSAHATTHARPCTGGRAAAAQPSTPSYQCAPNSTTQNPLMSHPCGSGARGWLAPRTPITNVAGNSAARSAAYTHMLAEGLLSDTAFRLCDCHAGKCDASQTRQQPSATTAADTVSGTERQRQGHRRSQHVRFVFGQPAPTSTVAVNTQCKCGTHPRATPARRDKTNRSNSIPSPQFQKGWVVSTVTHSCFVLDSSSPQAFAGCTVKGFEKKPSGSHLALICCRRL